MNIPTKCCTKCSKEFPATTEYFRLSSSGNLRGVCRVCNRTDARKWHNDNLDRSHTNSHRWKKANPERNSEHSCRYAKKYPDKINKTHAAWQKAHPESSHAKYHRRRARKLALPSTFTTQDWRRCLEYFHETCAYCENPPSMFDVHKTLHQDHYIAQNNAGPFTPGNVLPACEQCNLSKGDSNPLEWLVERFGKKRAKATLKRIQDYFEWVKIVY